MAMVEITTTMTTTMMMVMMMMLTMMMMLMMMMVMTTMEGGRGQREEGTRGTVSSKRGPPHHWMVGKTRLFRCHFFKFLRV